MLSILRSNKSLEEIKAPVAEEVNAFNAHFRQAMSSKVPLLDKITYYIVRRKGKQMRPMFVFLCAKLCGTISDSTYVAASYVELLHTASLVHDDVVDDANERRGFFSINALWKNKIAVLVGDFLLSRGLLMAIKNKEFLLLEIMAGAVEKMIEGELLQIEKARRLDIKEEIYYEIIKNKTASLIAAACASGAASTTEEAEVVERIRNFGEKIGIAFQIKDDLFDYGTDDVGKPLGIDIKEKKMTLPLIYALDNAPSSTKRKIINIIKRNNNRPEKVAEVVNFVRESGGLEYAKKIMHQFKEEAFESLETFPDSAAKTSLKNLVIYSIERRR